MRNRSWLRRHDTLAIAAVLVLVLAGVAGYNLWAARIAHRNDVVARQVQHLTKAACAQTRLFYDVFNALVIDSSPAFGSPPDGPPIAGHRAKLIGRLFDAERAAAAPLRSQGCNIATP